MKFNYVSLLLLAAVGVFCFRGLWRGLEPPLRDFAAPYAGIQATLDGKNPYDRDELINALEERGATDGYITPAVYPPPSLLTLIPFALPWAYVAKLAFLLVGTAVVLTGALLWARLFGLAGQSSLILAALLLASSPLTTALFVANPALLTVGLVLCGTALHEKGRHFRGGLLILWAIALKPHLGITGLGWLVFCRQYRSAGAVAGAYLVFATASVLWLNGQTSDAIGDWWTNLRSEAEHGDISASASLGVHRIDPASVWHAFTDRPLSPLIQGLVALAYVALAVNKSGTIDCQARRSGYLLATISIGVLLATYHRVYDGLLLIPCWLILIASSNRKPSWVNLSALTVSLIWILPGGGFWWNLGQQEAMHGLFLNDFILWRSLVTPLHAHALLLTALLVLVGHRYLSPKSQTQ